MAMKIEKILSCIFVVVILMSVVPGTVFAVDSGDNTAKTSNRSNVLEEAFTEKSFANEIMPFLTNEPNSSKVVSGQGECASVVKFKGTATTDENKVDCCTCYGSYYCNVKVEELLSNPDNKLKTENEYIVCYGDSPKNIKTGDKLEVYGEYYQTCGAFQYVGNVIAFKSDDVEFDYDYYIKKVSSECLSISVWTDKSKYNIGETVTIYYQTNTACTAKLTVTKPDGTQVVVGGPNDIPVCTRSKSAAAGYPTGTRTVTFEAWTSDESKEATCYFDVVEEEKPDLIIQDISWNPYSPQKGDTVTFTVKIKNQGSGSAGSSTVKYYIDGSYVASDSVPSLSAGSTSTQTFTWTADKCGNVQVKAVADATILSTARNCAFYRQSHSTYLYTVRHLLV